MNQLSSLENKIMKTLNRTITSQFYIDPDNGFNEIKNRWKQLLNDGVELTSAAHLLYAILRGKDYRRAFTPVKNEKKLANGQLPNTAVYTARVYLHTAIPLFQDLLVEDARRMTVSTLHLFGANEPLPEYREPLGAAR